MAFRNVSGSFRHNGFDNLLLSSTIFAFWLQLTLASVQADHPTKLGSRFKTRIDTTETGMTSILEDTGGICGHVLEQKVHD